MKYALMCLDFATGIACAVAAGELIWMFFFGAGPIQALEPSEPMIGFVALLMARATYCALLCGFRRVLLAEVER